MELTFFDVQRVDNANIDRTGILLITRMRNNAGIVHRCSIRTTRSRLAHNTRTLTGDSGGTHKFDNRLFSQLKDITAIAITIG